MKPSILIALFTATMLTSCQDGAPLPQPAPRAWFSERSSELNLIFTQVTAPLNSFPMPASIGSGGALIDFDNDGRLDVYLIHNTSEPHSARNQLFHQLPDGTFEDVSRNSGINVSGQGMGAAVGDVNNDGLPDLLLTEFHNLRLFLNQGEGRFTEVSDAANLKNPHWGTAAAFTDYDRDGWLDLIVGNYVDHTASRTCKDQRGRLEFCGPQGTPGSPSRIFRNLGASPSPRFEDVTRTSGLASRTGAVLGIVCADFNGDRWPDIFMADDGLPNRLYLNQQNGTFTEAGARSGIAYNALGATAGNMGVAIGDVDSNGLFDLFVTHLSWEQHALWTQEQPGLFQDTTTAKGLANPAVRGTGFGVALADLNNDGSLDLAWVNGHIKRSRTSPPYLPGMDSFWTNYAQPRQLFSNDGSGQFKDVSSFNSNFCEPAAVGRGMLCGDINNDGSLDLVTINTSAPAQVFINSRHPDHHWITVRVVDPKLGGRDAIGAEVRIQAGTKHWWRLAHPSYGYLVSNDPRAHFGLGDVDSIDTIEVIWPDGSTESFPGSPVDQIVTLEKGTAPTTGQ